MGATAEHQMPALSIGSKNVEGVGGLENLLIAHRRHGRKRHELAGVENVAIEFDVLEHEARYCFPLFSVLEQLSRLDGESATGRITAGDDNEQKLNQDLKWRHLAGLIGRHEISTQEIVARGRAPGAGKPFGIIH